MTSLETTYINHFREIGCAVIVVTPDQLQGANPKAVENDMKEAAQQRVMTEVCMAH